MGTVRPVHFISQHHDDAIPVGLARVVDGMCNLLPLLCKGLHSRRIQRNGIREWKTPEFSQSSGIRMIHSLLNMSAGFIREVRRPMK